MQDRLNYLESHNYEDEPPFYFDDLLKDLNEIYRPRNIADISNMDNDLSYEFLIALDNNGFLSESIDLGDGISMQTMDNEIEKRDLHYLYVQISTLKPFIVRNIWRYLKGGNDLEVFENTLTDDHRRVFEDLNSLVKKYSLIYVTEKDLKTKVLDQGEKISFYNKYFDRYSEL